MRKLAQQTRMSATKSSDWQEKAVCYDEKYASKMGADRCGTGSYNEKPIVLLIIA